MLSQTEKDTAAVLLAQINGELVNTGFIPNEPRSTAAQNRREVFNTDEQIYKYMMALAELLGVQSEFARYFGLPSIHQRWWIDARSIVDIAQRAATSTGAEQRQAIAELEKTTI